MKNSYKLETVEGRKRLPARDECYWRPIGKGIALGYRKPPTGAPAAWYVRRFNGRCYDKRVLGETDDEFKPGALRLSWREALTKALETTEQAAIKSKHYTVIEAVDAYFRSRQVSGAGLTDLMIKTERDRVTSFVDKYGTRDVASLTTDELRRWRDGLVPSPDEKLRETERRDAHRKAQATANRRWTIVRAALNNAFMHEHVESDAAWRRVKPFKNVDAPLLRYPTFEEAQALLKKCDSDFRVFVLADMITGMRLGELARITPAHVASDCVRTPPGKNDKSRTIPLRAEDAAFFAERCKGKAVDELLFVGPEGGQWTKMQVSRRMRVANTAAEIRPAVTLRDLRRGYGSWLANAGVGIDTIKKLLGHSNVRITIQHYAHLTDPTLAAAVQHLPAFNAKAKRRAKKSRGRSKAAA